MKKWEILNKLRIESFDRTQDKSGELRIETIIQTLFLNRGLNSQEDIDSFLHPKLEDVTIESVGIDKKQLQKVIKRIEKAIAKKEQIVIYGDYDVDGITSSAILWETLHGMGAVVIPYIPHRVDEGYGLSIKGIENILSGKKDENVKHDLSKVKLIITVDNGIVANAAVDFVNEKGVDVIITDHHVPSEMLPKALAIVHTIKLCGAGVAYLLAQEIKNRHTPHPNLLPKGEGTIAENPLPQGRGEGEGEGSEEDNLLELATLGTIADLVPLQGTNRTIVKFGLEKLRKTKRPGLLELFKEAGCDSNDIGVYQVGHIIAPRLNATGRMASAMDSLRLLCTKDVKRGGELASMLGVTNRERQNVMLEATNHAKLSVQARNELKKLIVVAHDSYPEGVIGLVAGRLVEEHYRPTIVISKGEKYSKGSVRSISGFNIIEFLRNSSEFFVNVGGHPMAAGFTIETDKIEKMQEALEKLAEAVDDGIYLRTLKVDCEIPLNMITDKFYTALQALAPFGMANPEPTFVSRGVKIVDMKVLGRDGKHLKFSVSQESPSPLGRGQGEGYATSAVFEAICFGMAEQNKNLKIGDTIDIAYTVDLNQWNGRSKLQLKVKDIRLSDTEK